MLSFLHMPTAKPLILLGADHAGFELKERLKHALSEEGWLIHDMSPVFHSGDDYPIVVASVLEKMRPEKDVAILFCGSGFGVSIAANRRKHIRATNPTTPEEAILTREHNHANVLTFGGGTLSFAQAKKIALAWLKTPYSKAARHVRRVGQLDQL